MADTQEALRVAHPLDTAIKEFVTSYEVDTGEGIYQPNEHERFLIEIAIHDALNDDDLVAALSASSAPAAQDLMDEQIIERCTAAGINWIPPHENSIVEDFPGTFDMASMDEMRALLTITARPEEDKCPRCSAPDFLHCGCTPSQQLASSGCVHNMQPDAKSGIQFCTRCGASDVQVRRQKAARRSSELAAAHEALEADWNRLMDALGCDDTESALKKIQVFASMADTKRLDAGVIMMHERNEFGEEYKVLHCGVNLRSAIDAAIEQQKGGE